MRFDFAGMGDDDQARKDMKAQLKAVRLRELEELMGSGDRDTRMKALHEMREVLGVPTSPDLPKGFQTVVFINGPYDGWTEIVDEVPAVIPKRCEAPEVQFVGKPVAVSIFYDVAVYELRTREDSHHSGGGQNPVYEFAGYSECMEGLS